MSVSIHHRPWELKMLRDAIKPCSEDELFLGAGDLVDPFVALRVYRDRTGVHAHAPTSRTGRDDWLYRDEEIGRRMILANAITYLVKNDLLAQTRDGYETTAAGKAYLKNPPSRRPYGTESEDESSLTPEKRQAALEAAECLFCHGLVDVTEAGTWQQVTGWTQVRKGGGANKLAHRSAPMAYAHRDCLK